MRNRATAVVIKDGKVLLVRDKGHHHFSLPGGAIKKGEPTVSAAARELYEELGLRAIKVVRLRKCDFKGAVSKHKVCLIQASGKPHLRGHELDKFTWWDMKKPLPLFAYVRAILSMLHKETENG